MITTLYLIRHAATEHNERRPVVLQGNAIDGPLSDLGRRQASNLAELLRPVPIAAACVSPMLRARQTVETVLAGRELPCQIINSLHEIKVGQWEGLSWPEIQQRDPEHFAHFRVDPSTTPYLGGETYTDVLRRAQPVIEQFVRAHPGQTLLAVSHNVVVKVLVAAWMGLPLREARKLHQSNTAINVVKWFGDEPEVFIMNADTHVEGRQS